MWPTSHKPILTSKCTPLTIHSPAVAHKNCVFMMCFLCCVDQFGSSSSAPRKHTLPLPHWQNHFSSAITVRHVTTLGHITGISHDKCMFNLLDLLAISESWMEKAFVLPVSSHASVFCAHLLLAFKGWWTKLWCVSSFCMELFDLLKKSFSVPFLLTASFWFSLEGSVTEPILESWVLSLCHTSASTLCDAPWCANNSPWKPCWNCPHSQWWRVISKKMDSFTDGWRWSFLILAEGMLKKWVHSHANCANGSWWKPPTLGFKLWLNLSMAWLSFWTFFAFMDCLCSNFWLHWCKSGDNLAFRWWDAIMKEMSVFLTGIEEVSCTPSQALQPLQHKIVFEKGGN